MIKLYSYKLMLVIGFGIYVYVCGPMLFLYGSVWYSLFLFGFFLNFITFIVRERHTALQFSFYSFECTMLKKSDNVYKKLIDPLPEIIDLVIRDNIASWYNSQLLIGQNPKEFHEELKFFLTNAIAEFSEKLSSVYCLDFIMDTVVNCIAIHIRIYKNSLRKWSQKPINKSTIEDTFFEVEAAVEKKLCHDDVCLNSDVEKAYLRDLIDILFYTLLSKEEFNCTVFRNLTRELLMNKLIIPLIDFICDADNLNYWLVYSLLLEQPISADNFDFVINSAINKETLELLCAHLKLLVNDITENETEGLNQREFGNYQKILNKINLKLSDINANKSLANSLNDYYEHVETNIPLLTLEEILYNHIGLDYFTKFMHHEDKEQYIHCFLKLQAFSAIITSGEYSGVAVSSAFSSLVKSLLISLETIDCEASKKYFENVLDQIKDKGTNADLVAHVQNKVMKILSSKQFLAKFQKLYIYLKMLKDMQVGQKYNTSSTQDEDWILVANITSSAKIGRQGKRPFAVYIVEVRKISLEHKQLISVWSVSRRYQDFLDLHFNLKEKFPVLSNLTFPPRTLTNIISEGFITKRQDELNIYLQSLSHHKTQQRCIGLSESLLYFFRNLDWKHEQSMLTQTILANTINPLKTLSNAVISPMAQGLQKISSDVTTSVHDFRRVIGKPVISVLPTTVENKDCDFDKDIVSSDLPVRVILVLMDEVFGLRKKSSGLRNHIALIIKEILSKLYGKSYSRAITEEIKELMSLHSISELLGKIRSHIWEQDESWTPNKNPALLRLVSSVKLLNIVTAELKALVGSETARTSILTVFDLFQRPVLNRRLFYVLLQAFIVHYFPSDAAKALPFAHCIKSKHLQSVR